MKRNVMSCVVVLFVMAFASSSVFADLSNHINFDGFNFGFDSYQQDDGQMTFSSNLNTADLIRSASVSISRDSYNPLQGWVNFNFWGIVGAPVVQKDWQSSSMNLNFRGLHASTYAGIGSHREIIGWTNPDKDGKESPIYGDTMSQASGSVTLSGVSFKDSDGGYGEYSYNNDGGKGFGAGLTGDLVTNFSAWAQFRIQFDSLIAAAVYGGISPTQVSVANVPEPATLAILGFGGVMTFIRRRRSGK